MADTTVTVPGKGEKRKIVFLIVFIVAAIVVAVLWWLDYRKYIRTDDANLDSFRVSVSAPVAGQVVRLYVMEGDTVKRGDTLLMLDHSACTVMAPVDGIIGKRWILPGDRIEAGQTALTLNGGQIFGWQFTWRKRSSRRSISGRRLNSRWTRMIN